jgi:hypothetical protein
MRFNNPLNYLVVSTYSFEAVINDLKDALDRKLGSIIINDNQDESQQNNRERNCAVHRRTKKD